LGRLCTYRAAIDRAAALCGELRAEMPPQIGERLRLLGAELREKLVVRRELAFPKLALDAHHLPEAIGAEIQSSPVEIAIFGLQPERGLHAVRLPAAAIDDPF